MWLSVVAVIISVTAGIYSGFDFLVLKVEREKYALAAEVRSVIDSLTNMNTEITRQMSNQQIAMQVSSIMMPRKIAMIAYADQVIKDFHERHHGRLDAGTYFALASEHLGLANIEIALAYSDKSIESAGENKAILAETMRLKGRALFAPSSRQDRELARLTYQKARDIVRNFSSLNSLPIEIGILADIVVSEANFGECQKGREAAANLRSLATSAGWSQTFLTNFITPLKASSQKTADCVSGIL
jgi:hypothetical protein